MTLAPKCADHGSRDCRLGCVVMEHRPDPLTSARIWLEVNERGLRGARNERQREHYQRRIELNLLTIRSLEREQERQAA